MKKIIWLIAIIILAVVISTACSTSVNTMSVSYDSCDDLDENIINRCISLGNIAFDASQMETVEVKMDSKIYNCKFKVPLDETSRSQQIVLKANQSQIYEAMKNLGLEGYYFDTTGITVCATAIMSDGSYCHSGPSISFVLANDFAAICTERLQAMDVEVQDWPEDYKGYSALMEGACNGVSAAMLLAFSGCDYSDYQKEFASKNVNVGDLSYGHNVMYGTVTENVYNYLVERCEEIKKGVA